MMDAAEAKNTIISLLDNAGVEYKIFAHDPIFSYEDAERMQRQYGWEGTEGKSLVLKTDDTFIVYVTIQGKKVNFDAIKRALNVKKVRLATPDELQENFGAQPGCAYPFGFDEKFSIYVDPTIFGQNWFVFSPALPNFTVQAKGEQLRHVFGQLPNNVTETTKFNHVE